MCIFSLAAQHGRAIGSFALLVGSSLQLCLPPKKMPAAAESAKELLFNML